MSKSWFPERVPCTCGCTVQEVATFSFTDEDASFYIRCPNCGKEYRGRHISGFYVSPNECNGEWNEMIRKETNHDRQS